MTSAVDRGSNARRLKVPLICLALLFFVPALMACGKEKSATAKDAPNVILISIDTLRADHLHGYGYERETSPTLDGLMRRGTSFMNAISQSPWTLPSHMSLFTSLYPHSHGVIEDTLALNEEVATLPALMKQAGYATGGFAACDYLSEKHGFGRGFDYYLQRRGIRAPAVCEEALKWLVRERPQKFFLFLHFYDVHPTYDPSQPYLKMFESSYEGSMRGTIQTLLNINDGKIPVSEEDRRHLVALYDAVIRQLDDELKTFFGFLEERNLLSNTLIVVTSDHGEEFFEHGKVLHSRTLYDELIRIPLIVVGPGVPSGRQVEEQVQLIDLAPTILEVCGLKIPGGMEGASLLPLIQGTTAGWRPYAFAEADKDNEEYDLKRAIRTREFKLYFDRRSKEEELYDLAADPAEQADILDSRGDVAEVLRKELGTWMSTGRGQPERIVLTDREREELRSLGYLR
jgi:arylsulfatase A-like enzyme